MTPGQLRFQVTQGVQLTGVSLWASESQKLGIHATVKVTLIQGDEKEGGEVIAEAEESRFGSSVEGLVQKVLFPAPVALEPDTNYTVTSHTIGDEPLYYLSSSSLIKHPAVCEGKSSGVTWKLLEIPGGASKEAMGQIPCLHYSLAAMGSGGAAALYPAGKRLVFETMWLHSPHDSPRSCAAGVELPTGWNQEACALYAKVTEEGHWHCIPPGTPHPKPNTPGLLVKNLSKKTLFGSNGCCLLVADHPVPQGLEEYYFEVSIPTLRSTQHHPPSCETHGTGRGGAGRRR